MESADARADVREFRSNGMQCRVGLPLLVQLLEGDNRLAQLEFERLLLDPKNLLRVRRDRLHVILEVDATEILGSKVSKYS